MAGRAGQGAGVATALLLAFLAFGGRWNEGVPNIPARIVFLAALMIAGGALGGVALFATDPLRRRGGWRKAVANVVGVSAYGLAVAIAFVLGMNGPD